MPATGPLPNYLNIEVTTRCNLRCVMCPHSVADRFLGRKEFMRFGRDLDKAVLASLQGTMEAVTWLHLNCQGEPLLAKPFWEIIQTLKGKDRPQIIINTNGQLLSEKIMARLLEAPMHTISFSLDAARPETYAKIRGADFGAVLANIRRVLREKQARGLTGLHVIISMVLMKENIEELPQFIELADDLGVDSVYLGHMITPLFGWDITKPDGWKFDYQDQMLSNYPELSNIFVRQALEIANSKNIIIAGHDLLFQDHNEDGFPETKLSDCSYPWNSLHVYIDGEAAPCCYTTQRVGNILTAGGVAAVWNGPAIQALRTDIAAGRLNPVCVGAPCPYVKVGS